MVKLKINNMSIYSNSKHSNYLTSRTAIVREQKQFIKIAFAVHLSAVISAERYRSDSGALKRAVLNFVFFIMLKNKIEQSAKTNSLLDSPTDRTFENRWSRYKEIGKKVPQAYRVYVEDTFLPCDAGDARIFSKEHEHGLRVSKHIFVGNSRLVTAMTHADNNGDTTEQTEKRYYYHADHLQSAQFITNAKGEQYEHIEYTPYGELWIEETAPGIDKLPFRFTGKELDEETGLYYYGARYLDPKYSRWLSGDPALNDYIPKAGADTSKLPNGGAYNCFNFAVFGYGNNNPIKYNDPTGETASYSIDDENKTITINVEIIIFGKDATSEIAQIYEKGIMDAWGGEWTANYNGEEYKVSINANVKLGKRPNIFQKIWNFFFGTKNYVNVENRERAYVVFGFYGNWRAVGRGTRTLSQDNPAGHEFGHLLGFDDRYDYNTQNPKPGWEGNIMAEATYKPSIVEQRDINRMVDYISNQKIFGYQRKHGNIRPWRMLY
nr:RHS repeat-associated core domain-containing protein [Treponema denticola]